MADIDIDQMAIEIVKAYSDYTDDVRAAIEKAADDISKDVLAEVRDLAPVRTGEYRRSFRRRKIRSGDQTGYTIWSPKHYQRTHLLEHGWTTRKGTRVPGRPHMGPAEKKYVPKFEKRVEQIIRDGG